MDTDLRQYLEEMKADIKAHTAEQIDAAEQRLKAHTAGQIDASEQRLSAHTAGQINASEQRLNAHTASQIDAAEQRLKAYTGQECERVETKLLTEFHKWGSTSDIRTHEALRHGATLEERMIVAEDRISAIERRSVA